MLLEVAAAAELVKHVAFFSMVDAVGHALHLRHGLLPGLLLQLDYTFRRGCHLFIQELQRGHGRDVACGLVWRETACLRRPSTASRRLNVRSSIVHLDSPIVVILGLHDSGFLLRFDLVVRDHDCCLVSFVVIDDEVDRSKSLRLLMDLLSVGIESVGVDSVGGALGLRRLHDGLDVDNLFLRQFMVFMVVPVMAHRPLFVGLDDIVLGLGIVLGGGREQVVDGDEDEHD